MSLSTGKNARPTVCFDGQDGLIRRARMPVLRFALTGKNARPTVCFDGRRNFGFQLSGLITSPLSNFG